MKKIFNARSPFWQLLIYGIFFYAAILIVKRHETTATELITLNYILTFTAAVLLIIVGVLYLLQIIRYNRKYPKHPIRYFGLMPPELQEEDEGMRAFTAKATRQAYIFDATTLPIFAMLYVYLLPPPVMVLSGLAFIVLGHFVLYLIAIWPVLDEE